MKRRGYCTWLNICTTSFVITMDERLDLASIGFTRGSYSMLCTSRLKNHAFCIILREYIACVFSLLTIFPKGFQLFYLCTGF